MAGRHPLQPPDQQEQNALVIIYILYAKYVYYPILTLSYTLYHTGEIPLLQIGILLIMNLFK